MSHSDDDDEFQSADEDVVSENEIEQEEHIDDKAKEKSSRLNKRDLETQKIESEESVVAKQLPIHAKVDEQDYVNVNTNEDADSTEKLKVGGSKQFHAIDPRRGTHSNQDNQHKNDHDDENDDDEEEVLAERIRERNLRIARKFSAEIAKNNKASAPIPVKTPTPSGESKNSDIEGNPDNSFKTAGLPPAPPPTPALSSSFNNLDDQTTTEASTSSYRSQYSWRLPPKGVPTVNKTESPAKGTSSNSGDQARLALDRLSEKLSQPDRNIFEQITNDIKKVSIKADDAPMADLVSGANIPSIVDLGSTLGGWGWSGASKLLSSASQVTSQVGSVLDSVVSVSQHLHPTEERTSAEHRGKPPTSDSNDQPSSERANPTHVHQQQIESTKPEKSSNETGVENAPNEALVDLTLNAMESLGRKAFSVMTERNESGSLQIKGLGRPWEHLINKIGSSSSIDEQPDEREQQATAATNEEQSIDKKIEQVDKVMRDSSRFDDNPKTNDDFQTRPILLKNRRRPKDREDNLD